MNYLPTHMASTWNRGIFSRTRPSVIAPTTAHSSLTFYYDLRRKQFDKNFYSPALTGGRLSSEQLDFFLRDVEHLLKNKSRSVGLLIGLFILTIIAGFWMLYSVFDIDYEPTDEDVDYALIYMMLYFFILMIFAIGIQKAQQYVVKQTRDSVQALIDGTKPVFAAQGMKWNLPQHFPLWIELWSDYREQPVYTLPAVPQYNPYVANYQMIQQQLQHANFAGNFQNRNTQNNGMYQMVATDQRPLLHSGANENKYSQLCFIRKDS